MGGRQKGQGALLRCSVTVAVLASAGIVGCSQDKDDDPDYEINVKDGSESDPSAAGGFAADNPASLAAFTTKIHPLLREHCGSCHGVSTSPPFAVESATAAHKTVVEFHLAAPTAEPSSRLVTRLSINNHNCWNQCPKDADEMLEAIKAWFTEAGITGGGEDLVRVGPLTIGDAQEAVIKGGDDGNWVREAENFDSVGAGLEVTDESTASGGKVLTKVAGQVGEATYEFYMPEGDDYQLWFRARAINNTDRQINYRLNGGTNRTNFVSTIDEWRWYQANSAVGSGASPDGGADPMALSPLGRKGVVTLAISDTHTLMIDMVAFTRNSTFDRGLVENTGIRNALDFDLSPLLGKQVKFRLLISPGGDGASYVLSNPTLLFDEEASVALARIYILVDGQYNPQYSTFASIDATVSTTTELSPRGLVIHDVEDTNTVSLGFGRLELAP